MVKGVKTIQSVKDSLLKNRCWKNNIHIQTNMKLGTAVVTITQHCECKCHRTLHLQMIKIISTMFYHNNTPFPQEKKESPASN